MLSFTCKYKVPFSRVKEIYSMKDSIKAEHTKQRTGGKQKAEGQGETTKGLPKK